MKNVAKSLVIMGAMAVAGTAAADMGDINPYVGVEYLQTFTKAKNEYGGSALWAKSFPGVSGYVGSRFHENFGVELGYNWSTSKEKKITLDAQGAAELNELDGDSIAVAGTTVKTKVKFMGPHLDLVGFLPVADGTDLFASVGYGFVKAKATASINGVSAKADSKNSGVFRFGVGASYMVSDMVGLRAKAGYVTTSSLKHKDGDKPYKNSMTFSAGAFVKF